MKQQKYKKNKKSMGQYRGNCKFTKASNVTRV